MLFSDFKKLCPLVYTEVDPYPLIQKAYKDCVSKIKLDPHIFPMVIYGGAGFDGWNDTHRLVSPHLHQDHSDIHFKEVLSILDVTIVNEFQHREYTKRMATIGEFAFGIDCAAIEKVSEERVCWIGSDLVMLDRDAAKLEIVAYAYPYFCTTVDGPHVYGHVYDIATMITTYGESNLIIDDVIGVLTAMKVNQLKLMKNTSVSEASTVDYYYSKVLNKYNENLETFFAHGFTSLGESVPGLEC